MAPPPLYVGTRKGLFTLRPDASRPGGFAIEDVAFEGEPVTMLLPDSRDGCLYAALRHGHFGPKLHRRSPDGSWEELSVPAYPPKPEGDDDPHPWSVEQIWALEAADPARPGTLWAGTLPGGLFRSDDGGRTWELNRSLWDRPERKGWFGGGYDQPGIHSICVDPRDAQRLLLGVSCGGVWLSEDGGETWDTRTQGMWAAYVPPERKDDPAIQDPHRMVACPADPERLWVAHHNGVFVSRNEGRQWAEVTSIEPSGFGFATAVHPTDPDTAWFVPAVKDECRVPVDARVVVARTRDGGETFDVLREGLPQEHAYDIVFRHSLEIDPTGRALAFGSTTGSLWTSHDLGDTWQTVSHHLPPVYCVRFAQASA